jgi:hypothetical protein
MCNSLIIQRHPAAGRATNTSKAMRVRVQTLG